jgi:hypothetical protein
MGRRVNVVVTAVMFGALTLCACSSFQPKLDRATIERGIEQDARTEFASTGAAIGKARCPTDRVQKKGDRFNCHMTIDGQDAVYVVEQTDGHGTVHPSLTSHYLLFATINAQTLADLRNQGLDQAKVACGYTHVWFVTPPISRDCVVTLPDHTDHTARVTLSADGGVSDVVVEGLNP